MFWGIKSRFHDLDDVIREFLPKTVEFHLTDQDVRSGAVKDAYCPIDYSIHLPEYWDQMLIDPCDKGKLQMHLDVYKRAIEKSLELRGRFLQAAGRLKVVMHPGGATVDPIAGPHPVEFYKNSLYKRLRSFVNYLDMMPQFAGKIEILVENMPPLPWFFGGQYYCNIFCDPAEIRDYCQATGRGICFDVSHMGLYCNHTGTNLIKAIQTLKPYIRQVHLADAVGTDGEGASVGDGNIDFEAVMAEIRDIDAAVIPEQMWGHKNNYAEFKKTITICGQYIGENHGTHVGAA